jgi:hypothetical protein
VEDEAELVHRGHQRPGRPPGTRAGRGQRMGATIYDIDSSHGPMLSHPDYVLDVIRAAASGV